MRTLPSRGTEKRHTAPLRLDVHGDNDENLCWLPRKIPNLTIPFTTNGRVSTHIASFVGRARDMLQSDFMTTECRQKCCHSGAG